MTVTIYKSTDTSAPVLTGQVGQLIGLLDACLVDGYGSKPSAGWGKAFSGTNKAVYRPASGIRHYLRVDDGAPTGGDAKCASIRGFESMSDVDTGAGAFPTVAQLANGLAIYKSATADATARAWVLVAEDRFFHLFIQSGSTASVWFGHKFGEAVSYASSDNFATLIQGCTISTSTSTLAQHFYSQLATSLAVVSNHYMSRSYTGTGTAITVGQQADQLNGATMGGAGMTYPAPVDSGLYVDKVRLIETTTIRGVIPGLYTPLHNRPLTQGDPVTGVAGLSGVTLHAQDLATASSGVAGSQCLIDLTGPWR